MRGHSKPFAAAPGGEIAILPKPTPETAHFWEGTRAGELRLQRCTACEVPYFPPRPFCPACGSEAVETFAASGRGRLYSYIISHIAAPGFQPPYIIAVVELEEGPRLLSNMVEVAANEEALPIGMPLEILFKPVSDLISLPLFRPAGPAG